MVSFRKTTLFLIPLLTSVIAVNDWSKACLDGVCEYSLPSSSGSSGSLKIWGSPDAITDITAAAGWNIIDCDPTKTSQDIRLVCENDESDSACAHLYQTIGAEGKIVRLPESCGKNAFGRISKAWVPADQSIPENVAKRLYRRDGAPPQVKALRLDTDFSATDVSKAGVVHIAIVGANVPGIPDGIDEDEAPTRKLNSRILQPRLFGFVKKAAQKVSGAVTGAVKAVAQAPVQAVKAVVNAPVQAAKKVVTAAKKVVKAPVQAAKKVVTAAKKVVKAPVQAAKKVVTAAKKAIKAPVETAKKVVAAAKDGAKKVVAGAKKVVAGAKDVAGKAVDAAKTGVKKVVGGAKKVLGAAEDVVEDGVEKVKDIAGDIKDAGGKVLEAVKDVADNKVSVDTGLKTLPPIDVNKDFNLLDKSLPCGPNVKAGVKIDVNAKAHAVVAVGVAASGTLIPPKLDEFQLTSTLSADLDSTISFVANIAGEISSPDLKLFEVGIPGLDFPGILAIGPTFTINANAKASLDLSVNMDVGIKYKINQAKLVFPPDGSQGGSFNIDDTPLSLSATPSVKATGKLEAHLIPSLNLGISALGDKVKATVFLNLDATASATLDLAAVGPTVNANIGRREEDLELLTLPEPEVLTIKARADEPLVPKPIPKPVPKKTAPAATSDAADKDTDAASAKDTDAAAKDTGAAAKDTAATGAAAKDAAATGAKATTGAVKDTGASAKDTAATDAKAATDATAKAGTGAAANTGATADTGATDKAKASVSVDTSKAGFGGCFTVNAGLSVNAGADADFFGLFDAEKKVALFNKDFQLFKKCFGNQARRSLFGRVEIEGWTVLERDTIAVLERRQGGGFKCPKAQQPAEQAVTNQTVKPQ